MVYLDYSATTKIDDKILKRFNKVANNFFANSNSNYKIAYQSKKIIDDATNSIAQYLKIKPNEIIYTSGASEANNLAIKGIALSTDKRHIITTKFEHSSVMATIGYLQNLGYKISFVKTDQEGIVDLDNLKSLINDDTFLISICGVDSELGIRQPIEEIGKLIKKYPHIYFHSDITQLLMKDDVDLKDVDLATFSAHKFYSFKGIGGLVKKENIELKPLIHGGKSTTIYRSGTPQTELIDSIKTAFDLLYPNIKKNYCYVKNLNDELVNRFKKYSNVKINSTDKSIPHILNISILGYQSKEIQKYFADHDIYISTKTACSLNEDYSLSVFELYHDIDRASSSIRISISYKTSIKDIDKFVSVLEKLNNESN